MPMGQTLVTKLERAGNRNVGLALAVLVLTALFGVVGCQTRETRHLDRADMDYFIFGPEPRRMPPLDERQADEILNLRQIRSEESDLSGWYSGREEARRDQYLVIKKVSGDRYEVWFGSTLRVSDDTARMRIPRRKDWATADCRTGVLAVMSDVPGRRRSWHAIRVDGELFLFPASGDWSMEAARPAITRRVLWAREDERIYRWTGAGPPPGVGESE